MPHSLASQARPEEWGRTTVTCECGWATTRDSSTEALAAYGYHAGGSQTLGAHYSRAAAIAVAAEGRSLRGRAVS